MTVYCENCGKSYQSKGSWYKKHMTKCVAQERKILKNAYPAAQMANIKTEKANILMNDIKEEEKCGPLINDNILPIDSLNQKNKIIARKNIPENINMQILDFSDLILNEKININKINYILDNADKHDIDVGELDKLKKLKHRVIDGIVSTAYDFARDTKDGRVYARGGGSLQSIYHRIRHTLCEDDYIDLDFKNCHPTILQQMLKKLFPDLRTPKLDEYINNRKHVLTLINKKDVLAIINGKNSPEYSKWGLDLQDEMKNVYKLFNFDEGWERYLPNGYKKKPYNVNGKCISRMMCRIESKCLEYMITFFHQRGFMPNNIGIAMFDGLMLWKHGFPSDSTKILKECEDFILANTKYSLKIVIKSQDKGIKLDDKLLGQDIDDDIPEGFLYNPKSIVIKNINKGLSEINKKLNVKRGTIRRVEPATGYLKKFPIEGDLLIKAGMSTGKTHQCIELLKQYKSAVWLSFRQSYTANVKGRVVRDGIDMKSYKDPCFAKKITLKDNKVIIQSESLYKIDKKGPPELLIIDECTTIMEQTHSIATHGDKYKANFQTLMWLIKYSKRRVFMDANLNQSFIDELQEIDLSAKRGTKNTLIVKGTKTNQNKMILLDKEDEMMNWIKDNKMSKMMIITSSGVKKTEALKAFFIQEGVSKNKIAVYNSETPSKQKLYDFENCNVEWLKYDIVICSPTMGVGVDFVVKDHFDYNIGLFNNSSCTVETCRQYLKRVRHPKKDTIVFYKKTNYTKGPVTLDGMDEFISTKESHIIDDFDAHTFEFLKDGRRKYVHTLNYRSRLRYECRINISKQFFLAEFVKQQTIAGWKVLSCTYAGKSKGALKDVRTHAVQWDTSRMRDIAGAKMLNKDDLAKVCGKRKLGDDITDEERFALNKSFLKDCYKMKDFKVLDDWVWIKIYQDKKVVNLWKNLRKILNNGSNIDESLKKIHSMARYELHEIKAQDEERNYKMWGQAVQDCKWEKHEWANILLKELGWNNIWDWKNIFNLDKEISRDEMKKNIDKMNKLLKPQLKHIGSLFKRSTYAINKQDGFKTIKEMLEWINPIIKGMYDLRIVRKGSKKAERDIFVCKTNVHELFTCHDLDPAKPYLINIETHKSDILEIEEMMLAHDMSPE